MLLHSPIIICPNLQPGVELGKGIWLPIGYSPRSGQEGRTRYAWTCIAGSAEWSDDDLQSGCGGGSLQEGLASLCSFLGAALESRDYCAREGRAVTEDDNASLFPSAMLDALELCQDELSILSMELEEAADLIAE